MKTKEFLALLEQHTNRNLLFEYRPGHFVAPDYHITEVKNISVDSVDCGAGTDFWKQTVIQLWEGPNESDAQTYMSASKALGILKKVDSLKTMEKEAEVKFEYSNRNFHTAQLFVNDHAIDANNLILKLSVEKTDCKAKETCGLPVTADVRTEACCTPGGGCC